MRKFKVASRSKIGVSYIIEVNNKEIHCNCPAGERDLSCNHKELIQDFLNRKLTSLEQLSRVKEI